MRHFIFFLKAAMAVSILGLMIGSCEQQEPEDPETPVVVPDDSSAVSFGTYVFDGDTVDILTAYYQASESYYTFLFSPLEDGGEEGLSTYVMFGLKTYWCDGEVHDVNDYMNPLDQNDDYIFVYEDPVHYYSQYRKFQSGTIQVTPSEDGKFAIHLDIVLIDGTPFAIDVEGELPLLAE